MNAAHSGSSGHAAIAATLDVPVAALFGAGDAVLPPDERGRLLTRINATLARMNEDQLTKVAKMIEALAGEWCGGTRGRLKGDPAGRSVLNPGC